MVAHALSFFNIRVYEKWRGLPNHSPCFEIWPRIRKKERKASTSTFMLRLLGNNHVLHSVQISMELKMILTHTTSSFKTKNNASLVHWIHCSWKLVPSVQLWDKFKTVLPTADMIWRTISKYMLEWLIPARRTLQWRIKNVAHSKPEIKQSTFM